MTTGSLVSEGMGHEYESIPGPGNTRANCRSPKGMSATRVPVASSSPHGLSATFGGKTAAMAQDPSSS